MVYTATYESADISEVSIDLIVGIAAFFFGFVSVVALVMLYRWVKKKI